MITPAHAEAMARYNRWQNDNLYSAAGKLSDAERRKERGAFWGTIHGTLNHILCGDKIWMHRLGGFPRPKAKSLAETVLEHETWDELKVERERLDGDILDWASKLDPQWLAEAFTWRSMSAPREFTQPRWLLVTHMFNHQTHHRGQVHCMLTQAGVKPGDTDLCFLDVMQG